MSGPWAESGPLYVRTSVDVSLWPLRIRLDNGVAVIECAECTDGELLTAGRADRPSGRAMGGYSAVSAPGWGGASALTGGPRGCCLY